MTKVYRLYQTSEITLKVTPNGGHSKYLLITYMENVGKGLFLIALLLSTSHNVFYVLNIL